jgi:hypothetical protein
MQVPAMIRGKFRNYVIRIIKGFSARPQVFYETKRLAPRDDGRSQKKRTLWVRF